MVYLWFRWIIQNKGIFLPLSLTILTLWYIHNETENLICINRNTSPLHKEDQGYKGGFGSTWSSGTWRPDTVSVFDPFGEKVVSPTRTRAHSTLPFSRSHPPQPWNWEPNGTHRLLIHPVPFSGSKGPWQRRRHFTRTSGGVFTVKRFWRDPANNLPSRGAAESTPSVARVWMIRYTAHLLHRRGRVVGGRVGGPGRTGLSRPLHS